jgi:hypothetical protein
VALLSARDAAQTAPAKPATAQSKSILQRKIIYTTSHLLAEQNEILAGELQKALEISYDRCYL